MATYKVPQDVEAEDKLIGPLSFRQFIYALVAGVGIALAVLLYQVSPALIVLPAPIVILFGVLALPLRKDQPMEIYLLAILKFVLSPHKRIWVADGITRVVEIEAPKETSIPLTHSLTSEAAERRLEYLSEIMDSRGWSFKHADKASSAGITPSVLDEASTATDVLDSDNELARAFDKLLTKKSEEQRKVTLENMRQAAKEGDQAKASTKPQTNTPKPLSPPAATIQSESEPKVRFNPYPTIRQKVVNPVRNGGTKKRETAPVNKPNPVTAQVSPGIMRLAHNDDLSISAIAREANRLQEGEGEVVVSLHPADNKKADK